MYDLNEISSGVDYLKDGYVEYAQEVISDRALPNVYDGLKPVHRRILYTLKKNKVTDFRKSARVAGDVLALHPHGDAAVYQAMVLTTDKYGGMAFPIVEGKGAFGGVYKDDKPAASRYTEVRLHPNTVEFFNEMNGIRMLPNFDSTETEPEVLPASFPAVLVNSSSGIAVGFSSNIPSFNFNDVCDLVIEYIKDGECHTVIEPDFVTGGMCVKDNREFMKLMKAGRGTLKLRAKTRTDGKQISCLEVPYGRTIQKLIRQINGLNSQAIRNAYDADGYDSDTLFNVDCIRNKVDEALYMMLNKTDLQYTYSANITVIDNGVPKTLGVWDIIATWVPWRREVLRKEYEFQIEGLKQSAREASAFMTIVNDYERKTALVKTISDNGKAAGIKYIRDNFSREEVAEDLIDFCASRSLPSYHDGGRYRTMYDSANAEISQLQGYLNDLDSVIVSQMNRLKAQYGTKLQRRTEITTKDFNFSEKEEVKEKAVDLSYVCYEFKEGFLRKLSLPTNDEEVEFRMEGTASDVIIAFDNRGRILRIYGKDLHYSSMSDMGLYLPRHFFGDAETEDYRITYCGILDGSTLMLLYKDGNVGFVDESEWFGNSRSVKVLNTGISAASAPELGAVVKVDETDDVLMVLDADGRIGWENVKDIKRKGREARTRVFNLAYSGTRLHSYAFISATDNMYYLVNPSAYHGKMSYLKEEGDFQGDMERFVPFA